MGGKTRELIQPVSIEAAVQSLKARLPVDGFFVENTAAYIVYLAATVRTHYPDYSTASLRLTRALVNKRVRRGATPEQMIDDIVAATRILRDEDLSSALHAGLNSSPAERRALRKALTGGFPRLREVALPLIKPIPIP